MKAFVTVSTALSLLFSAMSALAGTRHALVVGTNQGLPNEPVLEFAESDARAMATTFVDTRAVDAPRVTTLLGRPLSEVQWALQQVSASTQPDDELWLFLSGHADHEGIHVKGEIWDWKALRRALDALKVRRLLVFVDACNSGALLTAKGIRLDTPLRVSLESNVTGRAILASSGANELSYESRRLGGSPFAHFLASGLRGAADDGDGKVSLSEIYRYLYSRTVAASLGGASGPQHPAHGGWYRGSGEWWLTEKALGSGDLVLRDSSLGPCYVLDSGEQRVLAEVRAGDPGAVSLPPGSYRVKCKSQGTFLASSLELGSGRRHLEELSFETASAELVLARGPSRDARFSMGLSVGAHFAPRFEPAPALFFRHGSPGLAFGMSAGTVGSERLTVQGELIAALPWWDNEALTLEAGLLVGVESRFDGDGSSLALGPLVELSTPLGKALRLSLRQEMTRTIPLESGVEATLPLVTRLGVSVDL